MTEIDGSRALLREFDEWQEHHPLRIGLLVRWLRKFRKALAAEVEQREAAERENKSIRHFAAALALEAGGKLSVSGRSLLLIRGDDTIIRTDNEDGGFSLELKAAALAQEKP